VRAKHIVPKVPTRLTACISVSWQVDDLVANVERQDVVVLTRQKQPLSTCRSITRFQAISTLTFKNVSIVCVYAFKRLVLQVGEALSIDPFNGKETSKLFPSTGRHDDK
jgi:hypothetical protein